MKCEICQKNDAETVIFRPKDDAEEELYVCKACARQERAKRQKKSQRTRKVTGLPPGVEMSVTEISGEAPPPIVQAIMNAFTGMVDDIEKAKADAEKEGQKGEDAPAPAEPEFTTLPCGRCDPRLRIGKRLHLEALHLIGEGTAVHRAVRALGLQLVGVTADGISETGHVYELRHAGNPARAKRVLADLIAQERNARIRLVEEMPRIMGDSVCRSLAILKNARLLSFGEMFDLLSCLRVAAQEGILDGIDEKAIDALMAKCDLSSREDTLDPPERDRLDAQRADEMNRLFEDVVLNESGEEKFL